jgi:hypothetical protein
VRDDFAKRTVEALARRAGHRCSNPKCRRLTSGPRHEPDQSVNIGVAAHIHGAAPKGPRYKARQSESQRKSIENGIWLCQVCQKLVDNDPKGFSAETLASWKRVAEERARVDVSTRHGDSDEEASVEFLGVNQWNWIDGFKGNPVTRLAITATDQIDLSLVEVAYFGGGHRWSNPPTPQGSLLVMILQSSPAPNSLREYEAFFDDYNFVFLRALNVKIEPLDGLDRAMWQVEMQIDKAKPDELRSAVEWILTTHTQEIRRIRQTLRKRRS